MEMINNRCCLECYFFWTCFLVDIFSRVDLGNIGDISGNMPARFLYPFSVNVSDLGNISEIAE